MEEYTGKRQKYLTFMTAKSGLRTLNGLTSEVKRPIKILSSVSVHTRRV